MKKELKPFLLHVSYESDFDVLSFGTDISDAKFNVDIDISGADFDCHMYGKEVTDRKQIPEDVIYEELIFGLEDRECIHSFIDDYFQKTRLEIEMKELDDKHMHFPFW